MGVWFGIERMCQCLRTGWGNHDVHFVARAAGGFGYRLSDRVGRALGIDQSLSHQHSDEDGASGRPTSLGKVLLRQHPQPHPDRSCRSGQRLSNGLGYPVGGSVCGLGSAEHFDINEGHFGNVSPPSPARVTYKDR